MGRFLTILKEHARLLMNPVLVNAFIFYDEKGEVRHVNWGDDINYFFLRDIVKRPVVLFNRTSLAFRLNLRNYLIIGSTIDLLCKRRTEVWGAGIINSHSKLKVKPSKVYAVRGPLTRQRLQEEGVACPEIYGDPALLTPLYYCPRQKKRYKYGIIAHVSNQEMIAGFTLDGVPMAQSRDTLVINMGRYAHWHDIIDQVCSCESILSSSLHGLIVAEAYGVPNLWLEFGKPLMGAHFKFHDFFLSIHRDRSKPFVIKGKELSSVTLDTELGQWKQGEIDLQPLINACPFALRRP